MTTTIVDNQTAELPASVLVKHQAKTYGPKTYKEHGKTFSITATVRHDDQCGNGHNSFGITATIKGLYGYWAVGCQHDEVVKHFPELAPFIKWHLTSTDGPMHYVANTVYHATSHGPKSAYVYHEDKANGIERHCVKYCDLAEAEKICRTAGYTMEVDAKTAKAANLEYARAAAIWPDATREQLLDEAALMERLPALMAEFKQAVESLGLIY